MIRPNYNAKGNLTSYGVRVHEGQGRWRWVGSFPTQREARKAEARALLDDSQRTGRVRCEVLAEWFLARYAKRTKASTLDTATAALRGFEKDFHGRNVDSVTPHEAEVWAQANDWRLPAVVSMFNEAVRKHDAVTANPFDGLTKKPSSGRRDLEPLTVDQVTRLAAAAGTLGPMVLFAAYTGLRKGEVFGLEWRDVDVDAMRVRVRRRAYRGKLDVPKTGPRVSALLPEARDALLQVRTPTDGPVFVTGKGTRWSEGALGYQWKGVQAAYGTPVQFHELRHFTGHYLWVVRDLPSRVVATQLGHASVREVETLYGHFRSGALEELDRALGNVVDLALVRDQTGTSE